MDTVFKANCERLRVAMESFGYRGERFRLSMMSLERFGQFLESKGLIYSLDMDDSIIQEYLGNHDLVFFQKALAKLNLLYSGGDIWSALIRHQNLSEEYYALLDDYLESCRDEYSETHLKNIKNMLTRFFRFLQNQCILSINKLKAHDLLVFHNSNIGSTRNIRMMAESHVKGLLRYLWEKGSVHESLWMFVEYLQDNMVFFLEDLDADMQAKYHETYDSAAYSPDVFREASLNLLGELECSGYGNNIMLMNRKILMAFYTFLCVNGLDYKPEIAQLWLSQCDGLTPQNRKYTARRILLQAGDYLNGCFDMSKSFMHGRPKWEMLPEWCRKEILDYLDLRRQEKMGEKTISMDLSSCAKFCAYLVDQGLTSFNEVTAQILKDFNASDCHESVVGKNAYNSRIRKFLRYLSRKGTFENPNLYLALINKGIQEEKIIETLSSEDKTIIEDFCRTASKPMELRDKAIMRLGMMMGVRGCDIAQMKLSDIDWKGHSISFIQDKTDVEVRLYMPIKVGNAIYEYLKNGRPKNAKYPNVFLQHQVPYNPIKPGCCSNAIQRVLKGAYGGRYHTTRKSFATDMFRAGNSREATADATGHSSVKSLTPYISYDCEKMKECPLSLSDLGVTAPEMK